MSTAELRVAAASGDAWAIEKLTQRLLRSQDKFLAKAKKVEKLNKRQKRYAAKQRRRSGGDAFYRCARAF